METGRPKRLGERGWREVVARFEASNTTASQFCRREGISQGSLYRWRIRLTSGAAGEPGAGKKHPMTMTKDGFVELGSLGTARAVGMELKLDLGGGISLHLVRG